MNDTYHIDCCWSGRLESDEQLAQRAAAWFRELSQIDPLLGRWYLNAKTTAEAVEFHPTVEVLRDLFTSKAFKDEMGVSFVAWNGRDEPEHCYTNMMSSWSPGLFPAICTLIPARQEGAFTKRLLTVEALTRVLRAMVRVWEPDCGVATSREYLDCLEDSQRQVPEVYCAWLTYLSARRGKVPPLPEPVRVEPVEDKGTLIVLTPERFTVDNPWHISLALEVQRTLGEAGLLGPIQ